jgi:hypothetical protein
VVSKKISSIFGTLIKVYGTMQKKDGTYWSLKKLVYVIGSVFKPF